MNRTLLIRHAESLNQVYERGGKYAAQRLPDPPLSELGRRQAGALAAWAGAQPLFAEVTHLFSSPMLRAIQTASPLADALNLDVHLLPAAYEWGGVNAGPLRKFAPVAGGDFETLQRECPRLVWPDELSGQAWDGGYEPWEETYFARRAREVAAHLQGVKTDGVVALLTHSDFAQSLLRELLPSAGSLILGNAKATYLEGADLRWVNRGPDLR